MRGFADWFWPTEITRGDLRFVARFVGRRLPFLIAVNEFEGAVRHPAHEVRKALALSERVPVISVDARDRKSATDALIAVAEYALKHLTSLPG